MPTTLTEKSKSIVIDMIEREWNKIDFAMDFIYNRADELITLSSDLGLSDLSERLRSEK